MLLSEIPSNFLGIDIETAIGRAGDDTVDSMYTFQSCITLFVRDDAGHMYIMVITYYIDVVNFVPSNAFQKLCYNKCVKRNNKIGWTKQKAVTEEIYCDGLLLIFRLVQRGALASTLLLPSLVVNKSSSSSSFSTVTNNATTAPSYAPVVLVVYNKVMEQRGLHSMSEHLNEPCLRDGSLFTFGDAYRHGLITEYKKLRPDYSPGLSTENGNMGLNLMTYVKTPFVLDHPYLSETHLHDARLDIIITLFTRLFEILPGFEPRKKEFFLHVKQLSQIDLIPVNRSKQRYACQHPDCDKSASFGPTRTTTSSKATVVNTNREDSKLCKLHAIEQQAIDNIPMWSTQQLCQVLGCVSTVAGWHLPVNGIKHPRRATYGTKDNFGREELTHCSHCHWEDTVKNERKLTSSKPACECGALASYGNPQDSTLTATHCVEHKKDIP